MPSPEDDPVEYGHALRNLQSTIFLSKVNLDKNDNVTKAGRKWLEEILKTFGYNPALIDKLRPEYRTLAQQIIGAHLSEPSEPGFYEEIPAIRLLSDLPDHTVKPSDANNTP